MRKVKRIDGNSAPSLTAAVDQSMHIVCLWAAAWIARA